MHTCPNAYAMLAKSWQLKWWSRAWQAVEKASNNLILYWGKGFQKKAI